MSKEDWEIVKADYEERIKEEKLQRLNDERDKIIEIVKRLEVNDLNLIKSEGKIPDTILVFADVDSESLSFVSKEYGESIIGLDILFKYEDLAKLRNDFYRKLFPFIQTPSALYDKWTMCVHKIKESTIKSELTTENCSYWIDKINEIGYDNFMNMSIGEITDMWIEVLSGSTVSNSTDDEFDEEHATDMVLNEMIESFDEEELDEIMGNKDSDDIMSLVKNEMMNISESEIL